MRPMNYIIKLIFGTPSKPVRKTRPAGNPNAFRNERMERDSQRAAAQRLGV